MTAPAPSPVERTYVGVTGYSTLDESRYVHDATRHLLGGRTLMDGYLVWASEVNSRWRVDGPSPANFAARFISAEEGERIFNAPPHGSFRIIHFRTRLEHQLDEQLQDCVERFGDGIDGFQINWIGRPEPSELAGFLQHQNAHRLAVGLPRMALVLQLHPDVLEQHASLDHLTTYVADYVEAGAITHLLYDPSGGQGVGFRGEQALKVLHRLRHEFPELHRGVASGLSPENVSETIRPIWTEDAFVNIDVEGRVRDPITDALNIDRVVAYVSSALALGLELDANVRPSGA